MNRKFQLLNNISMYIMNSKRWLLVVLNTLKISLTYENIPFTCKSFNSRGLSKGDEIFGSTLA